MAVWTTVPSARPARDVEKWAAEWRRMGYRIAVMRDVDAEPLTLDNTDIISIREYPGYANACNALMDLVRRVDPLMAWCVIGGDDVFPDQKHTADEIAAECELHFYRPSSGTVPDNGRAATLGVMQPTGDRFAGGQIDRIAGSAWIGREFQRRVYQGNGPLWPGWWHMYPDQELQEVAVLLGCFWQRRDLTQLHRHFMRESDSVNSNAIARPAPSFLVEANSKTHWDKYTKIFYERRAAGFPGHELL